MKLYTSRFSGWLGHVARLVVLLSLLFPLLSYPAQAQGIAQLENGMAAVPNHPQSDPDLVVSVGGLGEIEVGSVGSFTLAVKNDSTKPTSEAVKFSATVDFQNQSIAKVVDVDPPPGVTCLPNGNVVSCETSGLAAGASIVVTIEIQGVKAGENVDFFGNAVPLVSPSDDPGNNDARYKFNVVAPTKPKLALVPMNFNAGYQLSVTGEARLNSGETYQISLGSTGDTADPTAFEWQPVTQTLSLTSTKIASLDLQIDFSPTTNLTETVVVTGAAPTAYLGFNSVPASGIATIGSPSLSGCGMSAYVTPPPVVAADAGSTVRMQDNAAQGNASQGNASQGNASQGNADLELECSENGEVEWHNQPNVGFAKIHVTFDPQALVQAAECSNSTCAVEPRQIELSITIQALPEVSAYLPLVY